MKKLCFFPAAVLLAMLTGCIFGGASSEPQIYSLTPAQKKHLHVPCQVKFLLFRNLSGSDRRFLYRFEGGRMKGDEFCRWILDPELMFERFLREELQGSGKESVRIRGVITCFEFDQPRQRAVLSADFTLFGGRLTRSFTLREEQQFNGKFNDGGSSAASAMEKCAFAVAGKLQQEILLLLKDMKKDSGE